MHTTGDDDDGGVGPGSESVKRVIDVYNGQFGTGGGAKGSLKSERRMDEIKAAQAKMSLLLVSGQAPKRPDGTVHAPYTGYEPSSLS